MSIGSEAAIFISIAANKAHLINEDELACLLRSYLPKYDDLIKLLLRKTGYPENFLGKISKSEFKFLEIVDRKVYFEGRIIGEIRSNYVEFLSPSGQRALAGFDVFRRELQINILNEGIAFLNFNPPLIEFFVASSRTFNLNDMFNEKVIFSGSSSWDIEVKQVKKKLLGAWSGRKVRGVSIPIVFYFYEGVASYLGGLFGALARTFGEDKEKVIRILRERMQSSGIKKEYIDFSKRIFEDFYNEKKKVRVNIRKDKIKIEDVLNRGTVCKLINNIIRGFSKSLPLKLYENGELRELKSISVVSNDWPAIGITDSTKFKYCVSCGRRSSNKTRESLAHSKVISQHALIINELHECEICRQLPSMKLLEATFIVYRSLKYRNPFDITPDKEHYIVELKVPRHISRIDYAIHQTALKLAKDYEYGVLKEIISQYKFIMYDLKRGQYIFDNAKLALIAMLYKAISHEIIEKQEDKIASELVSICYRQEDLWGTLYYLATHLNRQVMNKKTMNMLEELRKYYLDLKNQEKRELEIVYVCSGLLTSLTKATIAEAGKGGKKGEDVVKALRDPIFLGDFSALKYIIVSKFGYSYETFSVADFEPWYYRVKESELTKRFIKGEEDFDYDVKGEKRRSKRILIQLDVLDGIKEEIVKSDLDSRKVFRDIYHDWASRFPEVFRPR